MEIFISLVIGIPALAVAIWGVYYAREQVRLARSTGEKADQTLKDINKKVARLEELASGIKKDTEDTIRELISNSNQNFTTLLEKVASNQQTAHPLIPVAGNSQQTLEEKMMEAVLPGILEKAMNDPDSFDKFINNIEKLSKK